MSARACPCGHSKSQHNGPGKTCDYAGHSCGCTGQGKPQDPAMVARIRRALGLEVTK